MNVSGRQDDVKLLQRVPFWRLDQQGQSMAEFLIILPVMLLLIFGAIQFALIFHAKITLNYAAFEAARAGSLNNARFEAVKEGFARGLAPLYSYFEPDSNKRDADDPLNQIGAFQQARQRIWNEFDSPLGLIRIERLSPSKKDFFDFAPDEAIPNDNLIYRSSEEGANGRRSIQDANLLHLRITYWYPLYVPFINRLIFNSFICCHTGKRSALDLTLLTGSDPDQAGKSKVCSWSGDPVCDGDVPRIPLTVTAALRMQSPAMESEGYYNTQP